MADAINTCPNLLITRTFSKTWGLPSIRLGYIISQKDNIKALLNIRGPYDVNQFATVAINAALDNPQYTHNYVSEVMTQSKPMLEAYLKQKGVDYWHSTANFLWTFPDNATAVEQHLRQNNILIRPKISAEGQMGLRITIGDLPQTEHLIRILNQVL